MAPSPVVARTANSESVFKPDIFKGKVLFCTGGGSGICKEMTYAVVSCHPYSRPLLLISLPVPQMKHGANATIVGRKSVSYVSCTAHDIDWFAAYRLDRLTQAAEELSKGTGNTCIPAQADVRKPDELKEAVRKTIEKFGRIDFVICGGSKSLVPRWTTRQSDLAIRFVGRCCW
jgi:peroxisomal 2,4-dienoyl-CoA reductase